MTFPHRVAVHLSKAQGRTLLKGGSVRVAHHEIGSHAAHHPKENTSVHLGHMQHAHMSKAHREGHGVVLKFSKAQAAHHRLHGGGWWDVVKNVGKQVGSALANHFAENENPVIAGIAKIGQHLHGSVP